MQGEVITDWVEIGFFQPLQSPRQLLLTHAFAYILSVVLSSVQHGQADTLSPLASFPAPQVVITFVPSNIFSQ